MKRTLAGFLLLLVAVAIGFAWYIRHGRQEAVEAEAVTPVATIRSALPRVQRIDESLEAFGEVIYGEQAGLSFPRGGQISELHLLVGDAVNKGRRLATLVPDPAVRQAWQQANDGLALAKRELERQNRLLAGHLGTQSQVDTAAKAVSDAEGALRALDEAGGGQATSELQAPFDGAVISLTALQGERVAAGAPVLQLGRADSLRVLIGVEPGMRTRLRPGMPVHLEALAAPGAAVRGLDGRLAEIRDAVDAKTQLIDGLVQVPPGLARQMVPGMKMRARLRIGAIDAVAAPRNAVLSDERGDYLFQVAGGKAHRVSVTRRLESGPVVAIEGLKDLSLPIVIEGNYELADGMDVREAPQ